MAKVTVTKSDVEGYYTGQAGEFRISIERTGNNVPRSIDLVLLGLGTCTISTVSQFLSRKGLPVDTLAVELGAEYDEKGGCYRNFSIILKLDERIPPDMRKAAAAAAKTCRIHRTLDARPEIALEILAVAGSAP